MKSCAEFMKSVSGGNDALIYLLSNAAKSHVEDIDESPNDNDKNEAIKIIERRTGVTLRLNELDALLKLFPLVRIELSVHGIETGFNWDIVNMMSCHLLGCEYPIDDDVDYFEFLRHLRSQSRKFGYEVSDDHNFVRDYSRFHKPYLVAYNVPDL